MAWDIDRVIERIYRTAEHGGDMQQVRFLTQILARYDGDQVIPRMLAVCAEDVGERPGVSFVQEIVGELLWRLKLKCSLPPNDLLRSILKTYDLSVEQIPWALAHAFGKERLLASLRELRSETTDPFEQRSIETLEWWILKADSSPYGEGPEGPE